MGASSPAHASGRRAISPALAAGAGGWGAGSVSSRLEEPTADSPHVSVFPDEVLSHLLPAVGLGGGWFLDGTLGAGGHTRLLLEASPEARVLGLDRDPDAVELARARLGAFGSRVRVVHAPFAEAPAAVAAQELGPLAGALLDLGVSSMQLDRPERGFAFRHDGPLDMRMDPSRGETAAELLQRVDEDALRRLIRTLGEERYARRIAQGIVAARERGAPLDRTAELAELVAAQVPRPRPGQRQRIHPATLTFQALRLAVNGELEQLEAGLRAICELLAPGGRVAVIAFHSLEDRIVKQAFRAGKRGGGLKVLTKRPLRPGEAEVAANPRARSAKLRVAERTAAALKWLDEEPEQPWY
ncbi:MAG: 16S rRNA (cytosine(1402)-N(4))-methyltransferase RsmH [Planctomycetes bacterium]|nr:16S rRNA (cytosine(1402)-N(4))-methyltransferase RsmH [Planctomycetota bacterium]